MILALGKSFGMVDAVMDKTAIANALNPSYKSSLNIAQMRKDWRKCGVMDKIGVFFET